MTTVAPTPALKEISPQRPFPARKKPIGSTIWKILTTTDHKTIGIMYLVSCFGFFAIAGLMALLIRGELTESGMQFLTPEQYNQLFTMHGIIMLLFYGTPLVTAFGNFLVPLQIGAPDVAFPRLNAFGFWAFLFAGIITTLGFLTPGGAASFGWTVYPPLSNAFYSPGPGADLWIMGVALSGVGTILGAVNFIATIVCMRAPGMTMFRMPVFTWNVFTASIIIILIFPVLAAGAVALEIDRQFGTSLLDPANGGIILFQHLFWYFGHPEVYVLALPFFGIVSEIFPVFSRKPLFGYVSLVFATLVIAVLSLAVWAHHLFVTGAILLPFFSFMTFLIAIPTGLKFFNWIGTLMRGKITFEAPMLFAFGFLIIFLFGGLTGVILASAPLDFQLSETYFVVAHFHYTLFGTIVMCTYAGVYFWFPKMTGKMLDEKLGRLHFWLTFIGFNITFLLLHWSGAAGMTRRYIDYSPLDGFTLYNRVATLGAFCLGISVLPFFWNVIKSYKFGKPVNVDDPWGYGNSLEWATSCPPPRHNFTELPRIRSERPAFELHYPHMIEKIRAEAHSKHKSDFTDIN